MQTQTDSKTKRNKHTWYGNNQLFKMWEFLAMWSLVGDKRMIYE